jgi:hypothetical protein
MNSMFLAFVQRIKSSHPIFLFILVGFFQYYRILKGRTIGWDTTDAIYSNFLFMVDSVKSGFFPYYNFFTLGGFSTSQNFFTSFLYNPIDFFLIFLSTLFSPLYLFQIQFPVFGVLSGYWFYQYLKKINHDKQLSLLGGLTYSVAILFPVVGQAPFFYSFVFFAFLLAPFERLLRTESKINHLWAVILFVAFSLKAYFFFIPFFTAAAFCILYFSKRVPIRRLILVFLLATATYLALTYPVLAYLKASLSDLAGNFISPEPRLRSLVPEDIMYHRSFGRVIGDIIDPRLLSGQAWTQGLNLSVFLLFLIQVHFFWKFRRNSSKDRILLGLILFFMFMARGALDWLHTSIPLIGSARWAFSYVYFAQICYLIFICSQPYHFSSLGKKTRILISLPFLVILIWMIAKNPQLTVLTTVSLFFLMGIFFIWRPKYILLFSILVTMSYAYKMGREFKLRGGNTKVEYAMTDKRKQSVELSINMREVGEPGDYKFSDRTWIHKKVPSLNGYNNSIHPIFWYLKAEESADQIVIPICNKQIFDIGKRSDYSPNDNEYLEALKNDLINQIKEHQCPEKIQSFYISPEEIIFTPTSKYTLILQNLDFFESQGPVVRVKKLPGGIRIVESAPGQPLQFTYNKIFSIGHLIYLNISFLAFLWWVFNYVARKNWPISLRRRSS